MHCITQANNFLSEFRTGQLVRSWLSSDFNCYYRTIQKLCHIILPKIDLCQTLLMFVYTRMWQEWASLYCNGTELLYHSFMYSLVSLISGVSVPSFSSISYYRNLRLISNMLYEQRHLFYTFRHPCFHTQASSHSFLRQAIWHKWNITPYFQLTLPPLWSHFKLVLKQV